MQIASILIGGIERKAKTLLKDFDISRDYADRLGIARMTLLIDPTLTPILGRATLGGAVIGDNTVSEGMTVEIFRTASDTESAEFGGPLFGDPLFGEAETVGDAIFRGEVVLLEPVPAWYVRNTDPGLFGALWGDIEFGEEVEDTPDVTTVSARYLLKIECRDKTATLDQTDVDDERTYSETTDAAIITDVCGEFYPTLDVTNVDTTAYIKSFKFEEGESLLTGLSRLADRTGASFYVDVDNALHWYLPTANPAPWGISDEPDGVTTFAAERQSMSMRREWQTPCNRVRVVGAVSGIANISVVESDVHSQAVHGIRSRTIVDRSCDTTEEARARGQVFLQENAWPQVSGQFSIRREGLEVGQVVPISWGTTLNFAGEFLIRRVTMKWHSKTAVEYQVEFGDWRPDFFRAVKRMAEMAEDSSTVPTALPPAGSVTIDSLAGSLGLIQIVDVLPTLPDAGYGTNAIVFLTTDRKMYRRSGTTWVASVPTTDLTGTITTTQIADNSISTPKLQALSVTSAVIAANAITAGKVAADAITAGTIAAGAISASDAVFATAAIQTADIADAQITNLKIASGISASKITTGTLDAAVVTVSNLTADNITSGTFSLKPATGFPGEMRIYDSGGTTIAWLGNNAGYLGGWFQNLYVGGSGPSTAKIIANTSGNISVSMSSATDTFTITNSGSDYITTLSDGGVIVKNAANNRYVNIYPGLLTIEHSGTYPRIIMGGSQVLRNSITGWTASSGSSLRSGFNSDTASTLAVATALKALIDDLMTHGLIST